MSDLPPQETSPIAPPAIAPPPAAVTPPPQYAGYTRSYGPTQMGSPEKLEGLCYGYYKIGWVFAFEMLWFVGGLVGTGFLAQSDPGLASALWLIFLVITVPFVGYLAYKPMSKIGLGLNWNKSTIILMCGLVAFMGLIGYAIVQMQAAAEIKKYGIKQRFFGGFRKKDIEAAVAAMRQMPYYQAQSAATTSTTM